MSARLVVLEGGSPWGFRMTGGTDTGAPLRILRVNPGSKAEKSGAREGDVICSINAQSTRDLSVAEAHALLRSSGNILSLSLNEDGSLSPRRRSKSSASKPDSQGSSSGLSNGVSKEPSSEVKPKQTTVPEGAAPVLLQGVWSPANPPAESAISHIPDPETDEKRKKVEEEPIPPVWTPKSAQASPVAERREFRPVSFESPTPPRKKFIQEEAKPNDEPIIPPWQKQSKEKSVDIQSSNSTTHALPRSVNPTVTLLQKAREGQIPRGAQYMNSTMPNQDANEYISNELYFPAKNEPERPVRIELGPRKPVSGIGPTTKEGIPLVLRSEVNEENKEKWYKRMYDSLHKPEKDEDYVTVRYRTSPPRRGVPPSGFHSSGYQSEPEPLVSESSAGKYATLDRRRTQKNKENHVIDVTLPRKPVTRLGSEPYHNQPGRIENYQPGHSSISDLEASKWWDEVLEIFDREAQKSQSVHKTHSPKSFMTYALKESGYESDPQHIFHRAEDEPAPLSPQEHRQAYKTIQKGGEVPLRGLRKPAPERPKDLGQIRGDLNFPDEILESPRKYVESEVTIHYKSPVRSEAKELLSEEELARRQAEAMRRIYQEERRRKYLQELQDMNSRRHADNFTPSQKSPIPLNRYDDFLNDASPTTLPRDRTPEPRLLAKALFSFVGQTPRELNFRRGDYIHVRRQIDRNWCEGEHGGRIGLFPVNYVELLHQDSGLRTTPSKPSEGQARAKFNFIAQSHLELSLVKGELVVLTRRVDENWFEGRVGNRRGIFPVSYVEVLIPPGSGRMQNKPVASPAAHSLLLNGGSAHQSMGAHHYTPLMAPNLSSKTSQALHVDTQLEPQLYRVLYSYKPQNSDELELTEGDTVLVMEKCDDGWYVGSSQKTGHFGTFPGNYVQRI